MNIRLETALSDFRKYLFRKPLETIELKGSCLRLKAEAREIAELILESTGQHELPTDLNAACKEMNVHTVQFVEGLQFESELKPDKRGFTVEIDGCVTGVRRRAAIAHEIGHTLFYDIAKMPPRPILMNGQPHSKMDKQEWLSLDFARELLLPQKLVEKLALSNRCLSIEKILNISKKCDVSVDMLLHRFVYDLDIWQNCAIIISEMNQDSVSKFRLYRGRRFPKFRLLGPIGMIKSKEFQALIAELENTPNLERSVEFLGFQLWVSMTKYGRAHPRVLGVLEVPALSDAQ